MLHTLLMILKIILWIILAILGLVLLIVLLVLFSPIKYKIDAKYHNAALVHAKISFLIATVRVMFDEKSKKLDYSVRLAGIKLNLNKEEKPKKSKNNKTKDIVDATSDDINLVEDFQVDSEQPVEIPVETMEEETVVISNPESAKSPVEKALIEETSEELVDDYDDLEDFDLFDGDVGKDVPKDQQSLIGRIKAFFGGLKNRISNLRNKAQKFSPENIEQKIQTKVDKFRKTISKFKRFWNLKCTVKTRNYLKRYLVGLIKHIGPRSIKGYVRYGFGDPCKTGQITGYLSLLPFVYSKHFSLEPDFYEKVIDTELLIKGRIRIGYIIRIVLNINIWRTILVARKILKGKKKEV